MDYAVRFQDKVFTPDGQATIPDVEAHNKMLEQQEIEWLKTHPEQVMLYVGKQNMPDIGLRDMPTITTWMGTIVSQWCKMGPRAYVGFNGAYRNYINCRIFGKRYVGWAMTSSGDYCRLRKAKVQR